MNRDSKPDWVTIAAIGVVVYLLKNVAHEGLGHGLTSILLGGKPVALSSAWWSGDLSALSAWQVRAVKAGGTVMNLVLGLACALAAHRYRRRNHLRYGLWLCAVVSLLMGGGYLMVDPLGGFGDWTAFVKGLEPAWLWRAGLTATGVGISLGALFWGRRTIGWFAGEDPSGWQGTAKWLCLTPYFVGGGVVAGSALLNPEGMKYAFTSALANFGGAAWLVWLAFWVPDQTEPQPAPELGRSKAWLAAGAIAAAVIVGVLGPAIRF